jgi:hypothetical protein
MSGHEDIISDESYNGHDKDGIISRAMQYLFHQVRLDLRRLLWRTPTSGFLRS